VPLAVGASILAWGTMGGPYDGASMNPARSFGPDLAMENLSTWWVYLIGPVVGAVILQIRLPVRARRQYLTPHARLAIDTECMVELRPARAGDVAAIAAIDPGQAWQARGHSDSHQGTSELGGRGAQRDRGFPRAQARPLLKILR
jgi:Major intrinsic protein